MHPLTIFAFVGVMVLPFLSVFSAYTYTCHPDNKISIGSLPTDIDPLYYYAISDDGTVCSVTGSQPDGTADITGCNKDVPIFFTFGSYSGMLTNKIHGGQSVDILNITCNEISASGVANSISNTLGASIAFDDETLLNVTYDVTSSINPTSAVVGESVVWKIQYPASYTLEITICKAYPGTDDTGASPITLISDWCTQVDELITSFSTNDADTEATATIKAFKFYDYTDVFLECDVVVCPNDDGTCVSSCASKKKRSERDHDQEGVYKQRVGRVLHIIDMPVGTAPKCSGYFLPLLLMVLMPFL